MSVVVIPTPSSVHTNKVVETVTVLTYHREDGGRFYRVVGGSSTYRVDLWPLERPEISPEREVSRKERDAEIRRHLDRGWRVCWVEADMRVVNGRRSFAEPMGVVYDAQQKLARRREYAKRVREMGL